LLVLADMLGRVWAREAGYNNDEDIAASTFKSLAKVLYYQAFALVYGLAGACAGAVVHATDGAWDWGRRPVLRMRGPQRTDLSGHGWLRGGGVTSNPIRRVLYLVHEICWRNACCLVPACPVPVPFTPCTLPVLSVSQM
jgi:hypothetical protein